MRKGIAVLVAAAMALALAGCAKKDAGATLPKKITLGFWESPNGELLAKEKGLLEKAYPGVAVEWVEFQSGTDILTAIQSGSIDFATIGTPPVALGIANGYPFKVFYLHDVIGESEGLIAKASSGIRRVPDVKGKTVAVPFGTTSHFAFQNALRAYGVTTNDFTLLDMTGPDIFAAWQRGDIDGAYIWESVKSQLLGAGGVQVISSAEAADLGGLTAEVGIVHNNFYKKYPDVVKTYIGVIDAAVKEYRADPDGSARLMAAGLGLSVDATKVAMNEIIVKDGSEQAAYFTGGELERTLKATGDFLFEQKSISRAPSQEDIHGAVLAELY